jgi:hypothetical protein
MIFHSNFLPCISFFSIISNLDEIKILTNDVFIKQTYRNRAYILGANKIETLTVPVLNASKKILIKDVLIDNHESWQRTTWRTIRSGYQKSPFFEFYEPYFQVLFEKKYDFLYDLNNESLITLLKLLKFKHQIKEVELDSYWNHNEMQSFDSKNRLEFVRDVDLVPYTHNFGDKFVANLSVLDLLFCNGPYSQEILKKSFGN